MPLIATIIVTKEVAYQPADKIKGKIHKALIRTQIAGIKAKRLVEKAGSHINSL